MPAFVRSEITDGLVRFLREHPKEAVVTYKELSALVGADIRPQSHQLSSARRILERDHAQVWVCVPPRVAVVRLNDPQIAERQRAWFLSGARNKLHAGSRQADVVELDQLDIAQQARFATDSIINAIARESLSRATARRIEKVARGTSNDLPTFSAVEWMISLSPRRAAA